MEFLPTGSDAPSLKGSAERFTGDVWVDSVAEPPPPARVRVGAVHFAPGARTFWHRHAHGQTLHVTHGEVLVGTRDGQVLEARPGQTVWTPPGQWHWHGAAAGSFASHLAVSEAGDGPVVEWGEAVDPAV